MGLPDYFKTQRLHYHIKVNSPYYKVDFTLVIPTDLVKASMDKLNAIKGTHVNLVDEFKVKDEFKAPLLNKIMYILKDIERITRKDSKNDKFRFLSYRLDDITFNTHGRLIEVGFFVSGVCSDG